MPTSTYVQVQVTSTRTLKLLEHKYKYWSSTVLHLCYSPSSNSAAMELRILLMSLLCIASQTLMILSRTCGHASRRGRYSEHTIALNSSSICWHVHKFIGQQHIQNNNHNNSSSSVDGAALANKHQTHCRQLSFSVVKRAYRCRAKVAVNSVERCRLFHMSDPELARLQWPMVVAVHCTSSLPETR